MKGGVLVMDEGKARPKRDVRAFPLWARSNAIKHLAGDGRAMHGALLLVGNRVLACSIGRAVGQLLQMLFSRRMIFTLQEGDWVEVRDADTTALRQTLSSAAASEACAL